MSQLRDCGLAEPRPRHTSTMSMSLLRTLALLCHIELLPYTSIYLFIHHFNAWRVRYSRRAFFLSPVSPERTRPESGLRSGREPGRRSSFMVHRSPLREGSHWLHTPHSGGQSGLSRMKQSLKTKSGSSGHNENRCCEVALQSSFARPECL